MNLIKLPNGNWVNPAHVSSIELTMVDDRPKTKVNVDGCNCVASLKGDQRDLLAVRLAGPSANFSPDEQLVLICALGMTANSEQATAAGRRSAQALLDRLNKEWPDVAVTFPGS